MEFPESKEEAISLLTDFAIDTYPTLMAILSIAAYSSFVFMFYRILAKRDLVTLSLIPQSKRRLKNSMTNPP